MRKNDLLVNSCKYIVFIQTKRDVYICRKNLSIRNFATFHKVDSHKRQYICTSFSQTWENLRILFSIANVTLGALHVRRESIILSHLIDQIMTKQYLTFTVFIYVLLFDATL